jgi:electron transfer flavoprotein beta subunit
MKIGVCMKQVPDTEARLRVNGEGNWIDEQDVPFVINGSDECALEEALKIAEKVGGEVVVLSLGPERVREALRKAYALGATKAVHLADPAFAGGDPMSNGRALAAAMAKEEVDLVLTGSQSDDLGYGTTASVVAGHLGWPHAWLVMGIELEEGGRRARVVREMESGQNEIFLLDLPAVLEVQEGINQPRYAPLRGIMQAKRKEIHTRSCADLELDPQSVGAAGARLEIVDVAFPEAGAGAELLEGSAEEMARALVERLKTKARVL